MNVHASVEKAESHQSDAMTVQVWRGDRVGEFQSFEVPRRENQTVLDVVTEIQRTQDATLSYRFACRVGMCGSCAMIVNGRPRWTCRTRVDQLEAGTDQAGAAAQPADCEGSCGRHGAVLRQMAQRAWLFRAR